MASQCTAHGVFSRYVRVHYSHIRRAVHANGFLMRFQRGAHFKGTIKVYDTLDLILHRLNSSAVQVYRNGAATVIQATLRGFLARRRCLMLRLRRLPPLNPHLRARWCAEGLQVRHSPVTLVCFAVRRRLRRWVAGCHQTLGNFLAPTVFKFLDALFRR